MDPRQAVAGKRDGAAAAFTLVEVMLALALMSIIVTVMYSAFHTMGRIVRTNEQTKGAYQTARLIVARMRQDLACAHYSPQSKNFIFSGEDGQGYDFESDAVTFLTTGHVISGRDKPEGDIAEVSYYLDEENRGILVRKEDTSPDDELGTGGFLEVLGKNVVGLNLSYLDGREETSTTAGRGNAAEILAAGDEGSREETDAWKDEWDSEDTTYLPRAVRIDLAIQNEEGEIEDFSTTVVLAMGRTETSILPSIQQLGATGRPGGRTRGGARGPTQLQPGGRRGERDRGEDEGRRDFGPGRGRGGEERGTGRGPRSTGRGSGTSAPGTPSIRRTAPNAGSGTRPPMPGGRR